MDDVPTPLDEAVPVPHGHTARRLQWHFLPPGLRQLIENRLGAPVVSAESRDGGFSPGMAAVLTGEDGRRLFVKAASRDAQPQIAASYAEEARKLSLLEGLVPAPQLEWSVDRAGWVVLAFEAIDGRTPPRPWRAEDLTRALDLAAAISAASSGFPAELELTPLVQDLPPLLTGWSTVDPAWPHHAEATALAAAFADVPGGQFVHADLRDDNILFTADGRTLACDWNWPALGPAWIDAVVLLVSAHGDGLDAEAFLTEHPFTKDVESDAVDSWLSALCGFMLSARTRPSPTNSPHLRTHGEWYAAASWSWLAQRRGWQ